MDLDLIKFAYKHKLYCCLGNKPDHRDISYHDYMEVNMYFIIKKSSEEFETTDQESNMFKYFLSKETVSEGGNGSECLSKQVYPNLSGWNEVRIDEDLISKELRDEYIQLMNKQTMWYTYYDENKQLQSGYKPVNG